MAMALHQARGGAPGAVVAGRYRLDELLGETARAEVWAGHDAVLERPVTVKLVHVGEPPVAAARLHLPGIAAVFDVTSHDGLAVVVTERVDATPLDRLLDRQPDLTPGDVVALVDAVARVLDAAHRAGVPHGALRPSNILVRKDGAILLTDLRGSGDSGRGPFDPRGDLDAVALLLAELLAHCNREEVPAHLRRLTDRALTAPDADRPSSMLDLRMALLPDDEEAEVGDDPVQVARRRLSRAVLGLLLLAVLGAAVVATMALLGAGWALLGWN